MILAEQIALIRSVYYEMRKHYYNPLFQKKLTAVSMAKQKTYQQQMAEITCIMTILENALLRGEASRGLRYLMLFQVRMERLAEQIEQDCKRFYSFLV